MGNGKQIIFLVGVLVTFGGLVYGQQYYAPAGTTSTFIAARISQTSPSSTKNVDLIYQAEAAGLSKSAYEAYTKIWQSKQQDIYANLWLGFAAQRYWVSVMNPKSNVHMSSEKLSEIYRVAETCLQFAQQKAPALTETNLYYGNFLFWFGTNQTKGEHMTEGLKLMKHALMLDPNNARVHTLLGTAYSEKTGNAYNPVLAEKELRLAEKGQPTNTYVPWRLAILYIDLGRYSEAQRELNRFQELVPANMAADYYVSYYQSEINKHLNGKHHVQMLPRN